MWLTLSVATSCCGYGFLLSLSVYTCCAAFLGFSANTIIDFWVRLRPKQLEMGFECALMGWTGCSPGASWLDCKGINLQTIGATSTPESGHKQTLCDCLRGVRYVPILLI
jgi:hypothetical protein